LDWPWPPQFAKGWWVKARHATRRAPDQDRSSIHTEWSGLAKTTKALTLFSVVALVLFDIDGTLIRTGGAGVAAFARVAGAVFNRPDGTRHMSFAGRTDTSLVREFFHHHQIEPSPENFNLFFDAYLHFLDHLLPQHQGGLCEGVADFLEELAALPHRPIVGLLTGNIRLGAEIKLRHYGIWDAFTLGGFGDDHENRNKIAGVARERGVRHLGTPLAGEQILVVGDTPFDIECGRAIEAKVLAVATGGASHEKLADHHPCWLVNNLTEISATKICC
jgi:phosphoglycolate phosphatase